MRPTVRLQSTSLRIVGAAVVVFAVVLLGGLLVSGAWSHLVYGAPLLGLLAFAGVAALWLPYVEVSDGGVEVRNVFRTVHVPWPAITEVDGRYGLRLTTAHGRVDAWAAPAPTGRGRLKGEESSAALVVRQRRADLTAQGFLDEPRLEDDALPVTWHREIMAVAVVLTGLAAVASLVAALS